MCDALCVMIPIRHLWDDDGGCGGFMHRPILFIEKYEHNNDY